MASASSLVTALSCGPGRERLPSVQSPRNHEVSHLGGQRIRVSSPARGRTVVNLESKFLGQLELQRRLLRRPQGSHGGLIPGSRRKAGVARAGLPVVSSIPVLGPVLNAFFNPVVLFIIYAAGASRFWSGFGRTTYSNSSPTKIALTALWPVLFIASAAYRSNFKRAVQ